METTQHERQAQEEIQNIHENSQIVLLKDYEGELRKLNVYIENELVHLNENSQLYKWMKTCKEKITFYADTAEKCMDSYHFGCEILLYYIKTFMDTDGDAIKTMSKTYTTSISVDRRDELFRSLRKSLEGIPVSGFILKNVPFPLKEMLATDYNEIIESVKNYLNIGYTLKNDAIIENIILELPKLITSTSIASYYAAIIGPSFMGKTQTAFTLSHRMPVLYLNLLIGTHTRLDIDQNIYKAFFTFSKLMNNIIDDDICNIMQAEGDINSADFDNEKQQNIPLKTLGMIFMLLKLKEMRSDINILQWYKNIIDIQNICIPSMSVVEFLRAVQDLQTGLNQIVAFIDELSVDRFNEMRTKFARNICRYIRIPVILSGTNSRVNKLTGKLSHYVSGRKSILSLWVKIISELPHSTLKSLGCSISFEKFEGKTVETHKLDDFLVSDDFSNLSVDYNKLFSVLLPSQKRTPQIIADLKGFLEMLFEQSKKNLPGIAYLSISKALNLICNEPGITDVKKLWKEVMLFVSAALATRKDGFDTEDCLIASIHSLTFPTLDLKNKHEIGKISAKKVESHYFFYGQKVGPKIFDLSIGTSKKKDARKQDRVQLYASDGSKFVDSCYFPELKDDILLSIGCWQVWWDLINKNCREFTIGYLYQDYLSQAGIYEVKSDAIVSDSFSLELLAHWSICYASHIDLNGYASAEDVMKEFIINSQRCCYEAPLEVRNEPQQLLFNFEQLPQSLADFLKPFSVPYLVQSESFTSKFSNFIRMGISDRLSNSAGWDVMFDLFFGNDPCKGYIECKLWNTAVGLPNLLPYYKKAGNGGHKLSFLLAKNIQVSMQGETAFKKFIIKPKVKGVKVSKSRKDEEKKSKKIKNTKARNPPTDYVEIYKELWQNPLNNNKFHINLYSVVLDETSNTFEFGVLQEFSDPVGVFVLVQTNFKPPK